MFSNTSDRVSGSFGNRCSIPARSWQVVVGALAFLNTLAHFEYALLTEKQVLPRTFSNTGTRSCRRTWGSEV